MGVCIGYLEMLCTLSTYIATTAGLSEEFTATHEFRAMVNAPIGYLIIFPLSCQRDFSSLRYAAMFSMAALTYTAVVCAAELPFYEKIYREKPGFEAKVAVLDYNVLKSCALVFFSFNCQMQLLPVYSELVRPNF